MNKTDSFGPKSRFRMNMGIRGDMALGFGTLSILLVAIVDSTL